MDLTVAPAWVRYALAVALFLLAWGARHALIGVLPAQGFPFLTFFPAVMLAAYFAGLGPGLAAAALSVAAARWEFMEPVGRWGGLSTGDTIALVFFSAILVIDCVLIHVMSRALARLRKATAQLRASEQQLRAREAALRDMDRRKDVFLATLSHELRNPLAPIAAAAHALGGDTSDEAAPATMIGRQVRYMARLLDDLLDVSRITHDKLALQPAAVPLRALMAHAADAVRPLMHARGHAFDVRLPHASLVLGVDAVRIEQVLVNLLNNAAKYTPPGGRVLLASAVADGAPRVDVTDSGIGLDAQARVDVFERFAQVDASAGGGSGLGIGLSLARDLARLHGGDVLVTSDGPGQGCTFTLALPASAVVPEAPPADVSAPGAARVRSVVVGDDNVDAAHALAMVCRMAGVQAHATFDGEQALEAAQRLRPDALLLDIGMPRMDGCEVARRVRASPWGAGMRLVAISGWGRDEDRARSREAGFDLHLVKPVDPAQLLQLLGAQAP